MADKLKLPVESTKVLEFLSLKLNLRRNVICRIAMGLSLSTGEIPEDDPDNTGQEFNKSTIMGADEYVFLAMIANVHNEPISVEESFNTVVRAHIVTGLRIMERIYREVNSPTDFMGRLCEELLL